MYFSKIKFSEMKLLQIKPIIVSFILLVLIIYAGCKENPLNEVSVFSGPWKIDMSYNNSATYREASILIKDDGTFCNKVFIYPGNTYLFIQGSINVNGDFTAQFGDSCGVNLSGSASGSFSETAGITLGTGDWNDTIRSPLAKGTWIARRN